MERRGGDWRWTATGRRPESSDLQRGGAAAGALGERGGQSVVPGGAAPGKRVDATQVESGERAAAGRSRDWEVEYRAVARREGRRGGRM